MIFTAMFVRFGFEVFGLLCLFKMMRLVWPSMEMWKTLVILIGAYVLSAVATGWIGIIFIIIVTRAAIRVLKQNNYRITLLSARLISK